MYVIFVLGFISPVLKTIEKPEKTTNYTRYDYKSIMHEGKHAHGIYDPLTVFQVIVFLFLFCNLVLNGLTKYDIFIHAILFSVKMYHITHFSCKDSQF